MSEFARLPEEILRLIWEYMYAWQPLTLKIDIRDREMIDSGTGRWMINSGTDHWIINFTTRSQLHVPCRAAWKVQRSSRPFAQQVETREAKFRTLYFAQGLEHLLVFTSAYPAVKAASIAVRIETAACEQLDLTDLSNEFPDLEEINLVFPAASSQCKLQEARAMCKEKLRKMNQACERVMEWPHAVSIAITRHIPVNFRLEGCASNSLGAPASYCYISLRPDAQLADIPARYWLFLKDAIRRPSHNVSILESWGTTADKLLEL